VRQVGYLQELNLDAGSTKHKNFQKRINKHKNILPIQQKRYNKLHSENLTTLHLNP
jgi:hypothetical protein